MVGRTLISAKDFRKELQRHRQLLQSAKSNTDDRPPKAAAEKFLHLKQLVIDTQAYKETDAGNRDVLYRYFKVHHSPAITNTFRRRIPYIPIPRLPVIENEYRLIEKQNAIMGNIFLNMKSNYATRDPKHYAKLSSYKPPKKIEDEINEFRIPKRVKDNYKDRMQFPLCRSILFKFMRPRIYFDVDVEKLAHYGRIVLELFTEACPLVVLSFVRNCFHKRIHRFYISHIFTYMFISGFMEFDEFDDDAYPLEHDDQAVRFCDEEGTISFRRICLDGFRNRQINFGISFRKVAALERSRIAFGRVIRGMNVVKSLEEFSSRDGVQKKKVCLVKCGSIRI